MQLTVRDVARYFKVSERTVYRWLDQKMIPAYRVNDQYRFNRSELLEWAAAQKISVDPAFFEGHVTDDGPLPAICDALRNGGIHYRVEGGSKDAVLKSMVECIPLPDSMSREFLYEVLMARERMASTGVGDGIAFPHVRNPVILNIDRPIITLCFLERPVDFGSLDGKPVYCLFSLICPTARVHLHLISRLAFLLKGFELKRLLEGQAARAEIMAALERAESFIRNEESGAKK